MSPTKRRRTASTSTAAEGVPLKAAAFTNFSRDHLDYHPTMDAYFEAKMRLFDELLPRDGPAVIWTDDPKSAEVIERVRAIAGMSADASAAAARPSAWSSRRRPHWARRWCSNMRRQAYRLALPLIGAYQASNVLVAAGLAMATGGELRTRLLGDAAASRRFAAGSSARSSAAPACPSTSITRTRRTRSKRRSPRFGRTSKAA